MSLSRSDHRGGIRWWALPNHAILLGAVTAVAMLAAEVAAECTLVRERQAPDYTPHLSVHFGAPEDVPSSIQCSTAIERRSGYWCVPIYAWNLWDDVRHVEFALDTPIEPTGFDKGPQIDGVQITFSSNENGTTTSFELSSLEPMCGPTLLGCLRLEVAQLPPSFDIQLQAHHVTQRRAVQTTNGAWRTFSVRGGAAIGDPLACRPDACPINRPVADLHLRNSDSAGRVEVSWTPGSGSFTLIRYRTDGRYPSDPWDGEFLAFLPSSISSFETRIDFSGDIHVTAWSVSRDPQGRLRQSSNIECGSVSQLTVHQPIAVEHTRWHQVKSLYR